MFSFSYKSLHWNNRAFLFSILYSSSTFSPSVSSFSSSSSLVSSIILSSSGYRMQYTLPLTSPVVEQTQWNPTQWMFSLYPVKIYPPWYLVNILIFSRLVFGLPSVIFTFPADFFMFFVWKKAKEQHWEKESGIKNRLKNGRKRTLQSWNSGVLFHLI